MPFPEVWLRGSVAGFDPVVMPVVHALMQAREDLRHLVSTTATGTVWMRPGGAASVGFHVRHIGGSVDRLLTPLPQLAADVAARLDFAIEQVRATPRDTLLDERKVGRRGLPSTVLGLLVHTAEHTARHVGQAVTTAKILGGGRLSYSR
jgi:hypothetical protein